MCPRLPWFARAQHRWLLTAAGRRRRLILDLEVVGVRDHPTPQWWCPWKKTCPPPVFLLSGGQISRHFCYRCLWGAPNDPSICHPRQWQPEIATLRPCRWRSWGPGVRRGWRRWSAHPIPFVIELILVQLVLHFLELYWIPDLNYLFELTTTTRLKPKIIIMVLVLNFAPPFDSQQPRSQVSFNTPTIWISRAGPAFRWNCWRTGCWFDWVGPEILVLFVQLVWTSRWSHSSQFSSA